MAYTTLIILENQLSIPQKYVIIKKAVVRLAEKQGYLWGVQRYPDADRLGDRC